MSPSPVKKAYIAIAIAILVIAVIGGYYAYIATRPKYREMLVIGTTDRITTLDPAKAYDFYTWEVFQNIGEGLLKYEPGTLKIVPGLAERYEVSEDGKVYTFYLRKGLKFTDGTPFNATVVKWSIDRQFHLRGDPSWLVTEFVDHVEVVDEYTVKFYLRKPVSYFPALVATVPYFPISPKAWPWDEFKDATVGIGPYKVIRWERDVELRLEANPDYYGPKPKTKYIVVRFYKDAPALRLALETGEIDIAWRTLMPTDYVDFKKMSEKYTVVEAPGPYIRYLVLRCNQPPFNDVRLRRAIAAAVDRWRICSDVFLNTTEPLYSMIPKGMWSHKDVFLDKYGEHNITLARKLLTEAGYSETNKLKIELWYTPAHYGPTEADVAALIKDALEETGMIEVTLRSAEWSTYVDYITKGVMPIFLLGWYPDYVDPDDYTTPFLHSKYCWALGVFYNNSRMDSLLEQAMVAPTTEKRAALYEEVQELMADEAPVIPLFQGRLIVVAKKGVEGIVLDATMIFRYYLLYAVA